MIFGGPAVERLQLNEGTVLAGMPYQSMGDLYLSFPGHNAYKAYTRDLNISTAVASVKYTFKGVTYTREYYSSLCDSVLVVWLMASKPKSISCNISMSMPHQKYRISDAEGMLVLTGVTETHDRQSGKVRFITQVDEATIYISMATNFVNYKDISGDEVAKCTRLLDGNHAYKILQNQLDFVSAEPKKGGTYTNMFCAHPPFQIDDNFGCTAGIAEMLLQSQDGFIFVLPALPDVWKNGSVKGLKARGGFELDITWKDNRIETLKVKSAFGGLCRIRLAGELVGKGLKTAKGDNPNPYYRVAETPKPLISEKAQLKPVVLPETQLYDLKMADGETIVLTRKI